MVDASHPKLRPPLRILCVLSLFPSLALTLASAHCATAGAAATPSATPGATPVVAHPQPVDDLLANPGTGWQTFYRFADEDPTLAGLPSGSAYFRFYWSELEPAEGRRSISASSTPCSPTPARSGQRLSVRVMCAGTDDDYLFVPRWLKEPAAAGPSTSTRKRARTHWVPDLSDPIFQKAHFRFIEQLGKRYDGQLDLLDIGSVGLWGEWHMSGTGLQLPDEPTRLKYVDAWCGAFPSTPKAMLIGDAEGLRHAFAKGCGWRADCLGDLGGFSKDFNHMRDVYPKPSGRSHAQDVWKTAPVAFEDCWDMRKWKEEGWDVRAIFDYALSLHASYVNNKSAPLPEGARPEVERLLRKLGYRLALVELSHPPALARGQPGTVRTTWENQGVAPPYRDDLLAFRLVGRGVAAPAVVVTKDSVKGWLPGKHESQATLTAPASLAPGRYQLSVALLDPATQQPAVRLAVAGRGEDGWYAVSAVEVK